MGDSRSSCSGEMENFYKINNLLEPVEKIISFTQSLCHVRLVHVDVE